MFSFIVPRNRTLAVLLVVVFAGGAFVATSQTAQSPEVRTLEIVETDCEDSSYESAIEQRPADGGTEIVVEDVFVGPSPGHR